MGTYRSSADRGTCRWPSLPRSRFCFVTQFSSLALRDILENEKTLGTRLSISWSHQRQTSALFSSGSRGQSFQMAEGNSEIPCGYDEDFVNPIDEDLQCSICYLALREPILTRCGHRFCRECLERHMARFVFQICQAFCYLNSCCYLHKK